MVLPMSRSFLSTDQINLELIKKLYKSAKKIEKSDQDKSDLENNFQNHRACLYFDQPSTRTKHSFLAAFQLLGVSVSDFGSEVTSSLSKGESISDTLQTLFHYYDILVVRTREMEVFEKAKEIVGRLPNKILINAGSGSEDHPTQALLDMLTIYENYETKIPDNLTATIVGDYDRGRAAKSFAKAISNLGWGKVQVVGPQNLTSKSSYPSFTDLGEVVEATNVLYMMRLQSEYGGVSDKDVDYAKYFLNENIQKRLQPTSMVLHPLPRGKEIPPSFDGDSRALYWRQEQIGFYGRAALIQHLIAI